MDSIGRTMLHYLVQVDQTGEATTWVLETYGGDDDNSIDVDAITKAGITSLMLAVKKDCPKAI